MTSEPRPGAGSRRRSEDPTRLFPPPRVRSGDVIAGIGVAFVLIPQALAYADIVGVPPASGLYAATLPPIAAAIAASSPYLQTGPVAMTAFLTFGALGGLAEPGTAEYVGLAALLALVVGTLRLLIGLAGAGAVSYFISRPVLIGFTSAAALLIVASQLPAAVGSSPPSAGITRRPGTGRPPPSPRCRPSSCSGPGASHRWCPAW
jgi:SulP family sulfate permease